MEYFDHSMLHSYNLKQLYAKYQHPITTASIRWVDIANANYCQNFNVLLLLDKHLIEKERRKFYKRKKGLRQEKLKINALTLKLDKATAVAQPTCCCRSRSDCYGNKREFIDLKTCIMSQKTESLPDEEVVIVNASDKRRAWKNSATTAAASERDSLLTNSAEDRLTTSFDSRQEQKQPRESNRSPAELQPDNSNLLRVPSPAKKSGFYSTTPSTDEGIGTDDHFPDENSGKPSFDQTQSKDKRPTKAKNEQTNVCEEKSPFHGRSFSALFTPTRSSRSFHTISPHRSHRSLLAETKKPASLQEERYYARGCLRGENQRFFHYADPHQCHSPAHVYCNSQPMLMNTNEVYLQMTNEERTLRKRQSYRRSASSRVYQEPFYENYQVSSQPLSRRNKQQIWRQASERSSNRSPRYPRRESWTSVASCCDLKRDELQAQESPVLLFNRTPGETHSCEARLPTLIERRESEVISRNGIPISRIVSQSVDESNSPSKPKQNLRQSINLSLDLNSNATPFGDDVKNNNSSSTKSSNDPSKTESDTNHKEVVEENTSLHLPTSSEPMFPSKKDDLRKSLRGSLKEKTRKKSALAEALSSSVVATATGSVTTAVTNSMSSKEKQRSLTERLMKVGPSNPRRVQGIVQDILCEMGEERLIQYKDAFAKYDTDCSGIISSKQLRTLLRTLGHNPSDMELRELVNQVDMDENGKIDFKEFIIMIAYFDKANNEDEDLMNIFRVFDQEDRGCINVNEMRNIWNNYLREDIPSDNFENMINDVDNDGNGEINRVELLELLSAR